MNDNFIDTSMHIDALTSLRKYSHFLVGISISISQILTYSSFSSFENDLCLTYMVLFNGIFILTIFPLKGSLFEKILLMSMGNLTCLVWNNIYPRFVLSLFPKEMDFVSKVYSFLNPWVNSLWIVSFWTLGISFASKERSSPN